MNHATNQPRHSDYINLKHKIQSATKRTTLDNLYQTIERFGEAEPAQAIELIALMDKRLAEVDPYFNVPSDSDNIESYFHQLKCGGHARY